MHNGSTITSASKKSETCFPLNLGAPGVPGVGIGTPKVALRLVSEGEEFKESMEVRGAIGSGIETKGCREKI